VGWSQNTLRLVLYIALRFWSCVRWPPSLCWRSGTPLLWSFLPLLRAWKLLTLQRQRAQCSVPFILLIMLPFRTISIQGFCTSAVIDNLTRDSKASRIAVCCLRPSVPCSRHFEPWAVNFIVLDLPFWGYGFTLWHRPRLTFCLVRGSWRRSDSDSYLRWRRLMRKLVGFLWCTQLVPGWIYLRAQHPWNWSLRAVE
jgi:hypothetical protein